MVPNKSTMVEDSDDMGGEDDDDARSDAFALDAVLSRRGTTTTLGDSERRLLVESQSQVSALQEKVDKLEELVRTKDEELARSFDAGQSGVRCSPFAPYLYLKTKQKPHTNLRTRPPTMSARNGKISVMIWRVKFLRLKTSTIHSSSNLIEYDKNKRVWSVISAIN